MNLWSIPFGQPFLERVAAAWLARTDGLDPLQASAGLILLPTRRAARALQDVFLRLSDGRPMLPPRITAIGAPEETGLAVQAALDLPDSVDPMHRLAVLSRLILALNGAFGAPVTADRAWPLAEALAALLDEAAWAEVDLAVSLPALVEGDFADHWRESLRFLQIVTIHWPAWLKDNARMDEAARHVALLRRQADLWEAAPPPHPVWIAGVTGGLQAVARLVRVVARLDQGAVVLPGLDAVLPEEAWDSLTPSHPQYALKRLLRLLHTVRDDVRPWGGASFPAHGRPPAHGRAASLTRALLPAQALADWRRLDDPPVIEGISRLRPRDETQEAAAIAMALRDGLETPGRRVALITPDRTLAVRVAAALRRFGVVADDSAGEPLAVTPPAIFLRLLAWAAQEGLAPVALLSLLKHPLAAFGLPPAACRTAARRLERACLRGPRPAPGVAGIRAVLPDDAPPAATDLVDRLDRVLTPLCALLSQSAIAPDRLLTVLLETAEAATTTDEDPGANLLWRAEEGNALSAHLSAVLPALAVLPPQPPDRLGALLDLVLSGAVAHTRRALRGGGEEEHPRLFIWGLLEARLQSVDLAVLGGLSETIWPAAQDPGPWLNRAMRRESGLPLPEERIGEMAHDFLMAACAAGEVILSCPLRRDGAPAVPSRWLARLEALLRGHGMCLPDHPAAAWAARLDHHPDPPRPAPPPAPRPPVDARPRTLSVTEIETWLRDPYAIYAKHILNLKALKPLDQPADAADYGEIVHKGIAAFLQACGVDLPPNAAARLCATFRRAMETAGIRPALQRWWRPRLDRIAEWVIAQERLRRQGGAPQIIRAEANGAWCFPCPAGPFTLRGRADRIERTAEGVLAILDYKTGVLPTEAELHAGLAPQLPLEAAMAASGAFGVDLTGPVGELSYWRLTGGGEAGSVKILFGGEQEKVAQACLAAQERLQALIEDFDHPDRAYLSRPHPKASPRFSDYAQLARLAEWGWGEEA